MRLSWLVVLVACSGGSKDQVVSTPPTGSAEPPLGSSRAGSNPPATGSATPATRPTPPPLPVDARPIDHGKLSQLVNARHPQHGWIHASKAGGCHVYLADGKPRPPGSFPAATPVDCPPAMLAPEWGYCTGSGMVQSSAAGDECICSPGDGDPPPKSFRMPCPTTP